MTGRPRLEIWIRDEAVVHDGEQVGYEVIAELQPGDGSASGIFDPADAPDELVRDAITAIGDGSYTKADAVALGRRLFDALFPDEVLALYRYAAHPRLRLFVDLPAARAIPWELLHDGRRFVAEGVPVSRGVKNLPPASALAVDGPLRVLIVDAHPDGVQRLDASYEAAAIERALGALPRDAVSVTTKAGVTVPWLIRVLSEARQARRPFHVLHFIGHGQQVDGAGELLFEDDVVPADGRRPPPVPVGTTQLVNIVTDDADGDGHQDLKLVFLNACRSAEHSAADAVDSFAPPLLAAGIPAVVGMQNKVFDDVAASFAADFYAALAARVPIDEALWHARLTAGSINPHLVADLGVPVLYLRSETGELFAAPPIVVEGDGGDSDEPPKPWWRRAVTSAWAAAFGAVFGAIVLGAVTPLGEAVTDLYCDGPFRPVTFMCTDKPAMELTKFNVAIAEFDAADPDDRATARSLSNTLSDAMEDNILEFGFTGFWGPEQTGAVRGATDDEREANANRRADEINADIIVYGRLEPTRSGVELLPEFYVNDRRAEFAEANASELTGRYQLGDEEVVDPANLVSANQAFNAAMEGRATAVAQFVEGLSYYSVRPPDYEKAILSFKAAEGIEAWQASEGQEILHMFVGNAEGRIAAQADPSSAEQVEHIDEALAAYERSLDVDDEYARALLGKAESQFALAGGLTCDQTLEDDLMGAAKQTYDDARNAANKPLHADVDLKADFGQARIFTCQRLAGAAATGDPTPLLQGVIDAHDAGNERLARLAAESHAQLGHNARVDGDYAAAADHYAASASSLKELELPDRAAVMWRSAAGHLALLPDRCDEALESYDRALKIVVDDELEMKIETDRNALACA